MCLCSLHATRVYFYPPVCVMHTKHTHTHTHTHTNTHTCTHAPTLSLFLFHNVLFSGKQGLWDASFSVSLPLTHTNTHTRIHIYTQCMVPREWRPLRCLQCRGNVDGSSNLACLLFSGYIYFVYVYVYTYIYTNIYTYVYVYVYVFICLCACICRGHMYVSLHLAWLLLSWCM